jgi:uncharacterized membrane protein
MRPALIERHIPAWEQERARRHEAAARFAEQIERRHDLVEACTVWALLALAAVVSVAVLLTR